MEKKGLDPARRFDATIVKVGTSSAFSVEYKRTSGFDQFCKPRMRGVSGEHLAPDSISVRPAERQVAAQLAILCTSDSVAELRQNSADLNILVGIVQIDDADWMKSLEHTACTGKRLCLR